MVLGAIAIAFGVFGFIMSSAFGAARADKDSWANGLAAAGAGGIAVALAFAFAAGRLG